MMASLPSFPTRSPPPVFATDLARHGAAVALVTDTGQVSYAELADRAVRFAARLGAGRKLVVIETAPTAEFVAAYLGALGAGHAVAPVAHGEVDAFRARFNPDAVYARMAGRWRLLIDGRGAGALHPDLALVLMTSGSTGQGKAVRLSARAVEANAAAIAGYLGLQASERAALVLPLHYSFGLSVLHSHLSVGASVWLAEGGLLQNGFLDTLRQVRATSLSTVPHGCEVLARIGFDPATVPDLSTLTVAGGPLALHRLRDLAGRMQANGGRFFAMYGQTEATARIAYVPPDLAPGLDRPGVIGVAVPGGRLWLRDGELVYDGPGVMMGYAMGRADLARGAEVTALATGDLAVQDPDGLFRITGRARRMSKIAGFRIGHDALEVGLAEAGVVAAVWGDDHNLCIAAEGEDDAPMWPLVQRLTGLTPRHVTLHRVDALPRLTNGKIDYPRLIAEGERNATARADGIGRAYAEAFYPRPVRPCDSFASLGGDSLRHVELAMVIEARLGHLPQGWEALPLARLDGLHAPSAQRDAAAPGATDDADAPSTATLDSALVLRALAVLAVVATHETLWPLYGGAAVMVVLIGVMLARFQREAMATGDVRRLLVPLVRVLVPYYLIVAAYALAWGQVPWGSVLLVSNFGIGAPSDFDRLPFMYWFVEAFAQMVLLLAALVLVPQVRRLVQRDAFRFGLWFLGGAMVFRFVFPLLWDIGGQRIFTLAWVLYLAALGWLVGAARGARQRTLVLALAAPVLASVAFYGGNWYGAWTKYGSVFAVVAVLLYQPQMRLPKPLVRPLLAVAGASYLIYLTHRFVPNLLLAPLAGDLPRWVFATLSIGGGICLGLAAFALQRRAVRLLSRMSSLLLHPVSNTPRGVRGV